MSTAAGRLPAAAPLRSTLPERLDRLTFCFVLLALVAGILFASAPLLFGGPNVILAGAAIGLFALRMLTKKYIEIHWSFTLFLLSGLVMTVWAIRVHAATGTMEYARIGQIGVGIGIAAATYTAVSAANARLLLYAAVLSVLASAAFGLAVLYEKETFGPLWRTIAAPEERLIWPVLWDGRLAGAANGIETFGSHVAMAVPITVAIWLHHIGRDPIKTGSVIALDLLLLFWFVAVWMTSSRSLAVAVLLGGVLTLIVAIACRPRAKTRRLASRVLLTASCIYVAGILITHADELARGHPGAGPALQVSDESAAPEQSAPPAPISCTESLGNLSPPVFVSGGWREECSTAHEAPAHGEYARYYSFVMEREAFLAIRTVTDADCCRAALLPGELSEAGAAVEPLAEKELGPDGGFLRAGLAPGAYTLAVVTDGPGLAHGFELEIGLDMAKSWFKPFAPKRLVSIQHRYRMFEVAYRYALDHPMGAGGFFPADRHLEGLDPALRRNFLEASELHNHLLTVLAHYGLPGLAVSLLFFGCLFWSAGHSVARAGRLRDPYALYLSGAVAGALTACFVFMLLFSTGPFFRSWHYFFVFGLVFGVQRILAAAPDEIPRRSPPDGGVVEVAQQGVRLEQ